MLLKIVLLLLFILGAVYYLTAIITGLLHINDKSENIFLYIIPFYCWFHALRIQRSKPAKNEDKEAPVEKPGTGESADATPTDAPETTKRKRGRPRKEKPAETTEYESVE